mgnify:FL=1
MQAGELKHKIELYKNEGSVNNPVLVFYKKIYAAVNYKNGNSVIQSYSIFNTKTQTLKIRKITDINDLMYIKFKDEYYLIACIQEVDNIQIIDIVLTNYKD